mgnify:CR=1 FL=1
MSSRRVFTNVGVILIAGLVTKLFGFVREVLVANSFGASVETDAFLVAFSIPTLLFVSLGSALGTIFIAVFSEYLTRRGREEAFELATSLLNLLILASLGLTLLGIALAPQIVSLLAPGFEGYSFDLTVKMTRIMFPLLVVLVLTYLQTGILQSFEQFVIPAVLSIPYNLLLIVFLLFFDRYFGIVGFAVTTVIAWSLQFIIQVWPVGRTGYRYRPRLDWGHPGVRRVLLLSGPVIAGGIIQQLNSFVNQALASDMLGGSVSAFNFSYKLYFIATSVFALAVTTFFFPSLSRLAAQRDLKALTGSLDQSLRMVAVLLVPVMLGFIFLRLPLVEVVLERGAFTHEASLMTSGALFYFALGALFFGVQEVLNKGFYALQDSRTPMYLAITSVLVNIGLSLALARPMGLNGLALANTLATAVLAALLALMLRQRLRDMAAETPAAVSGTAAEQPEPAGAATDREHSPAAFLLRLALAGAVTGLALWFSSALFFTRLALPGWAGLTLALGVSGLAYAAALAALGLVSPRKILARG